MYSSLSKQQLLGRLFSNAGIYGVTIILTRIGGLVLLPVYWHALEPADFGIIALAQLVTLLLAPVLSAGLYDAVQRMYHEWSADERPRHLAALWSVSLVLSAAVCLCLHLFGERVFSLLLAQVKFSPYIELTIWIAFTSNLNLFPLTVMRVREELVRYSLVIAGMFVTQAGAILLFLFVFDWKAQGYLAGMLASGAVWGVYFVGFMLRESRFPWSVRHLSNSLRYSLPLVPGSIMEGVGSIFDRYFLDKSVGLGLIGLYNLGNQFGGAVNSFNQILKASWIPLIIRVVSEREDARRILGQFSLYYVAAMTVPCLAVALLSKELIELFGNDRFSGVYPFVPWFVLIYYIQSVGTAMGRGLDLAKKTMLSPVVPLVGIFFNFLGMYLLVPRFGVWGAVAAFLITTVARIGVHIWLAVSVYPRPLFLWSLLKVNLVALAIFLIGQRMDMGHLGWTLLVKSLWVAGGAVVIAWLALDWARAVRLIRMLTGRGVR